MKAIAIHEFGGPSVLQYEDFDEPVAGAGEVLVKVTAASVNPIDYKIRKGLAQERFPITFPWIPGRDVSGIVMSLGEGVTGFEPGDKVMALAWSTYAEYTVIKAADMVKVPEKLDIVDAAAVPLVTQTGEQLIRLGAKIQAGQTVLITGALGAVGRSAVWAAKEMGANVIAGVRNKQLDEASELKATQILALDDPDALARLGFIDAVADTVGGATGQMLIGKVRQGGIYATVVSPPVDASLHPTVTLNRLMAKPDAMSLAKLAQAVASGKLRIPIDRMVALKDAQAAHEAVEKGGVGKILLLA
jgi:NADPH:quinone reductase-like Zn-dependent oxidoreductase